MYNRIEPEPLVRHFAAHPPAGFESATVGGAPAFVADFDLLTTADGLLRRLPPLRARTLFVGTTVTEYAVLDGEPQALVAEVVRHASRYPFTIIKDLPAEPLLAGDAAFEHARRVVDACRAANFMIVEGQALAYVPIDFPSVDDFLSRMSHARRKNIRRKLRSRERLSIEEIPTGGDLDVDELYPLYRNVYDQSDVRFDLLTRDFFAAVLRDASIDGTVVLYRASGTLIGFNLCVFENAMYVDKYVGFRYPAAREHDLYTVSWFYNLERARERGCRFYIAGWTDPEVKRSLGARFTWTRHAVYIRNRALRAIARVATPLFESDRRWHDEHAGS